VVGVMRKDDYDQIYKPTQPVSGEKHSPLGVLYRACLSFFAAFWESTLLAISTRSASSMNAGRRKAGFSPSMRVSSGPTFRIGSEP